MSRQRIRRGLLVLALATLAGAVAAPAVAEAGTTAKPGKGNPCQVVEKAADKAENTDKSKSIRVLVCGDIAKINGKQRLASLTLKTAKGPVVVQVARDTAVYKGDVKVSHKALKVGAPVAIKAEVTRNGTVKAFAIVLL